MKIKNVNIAGLKIIKTKMFFDNRGFFKEVFRNNLIKKNFKFDVMSSSKKNVIRGLHIQTKKPQAKVITVVSGKIIKFDNGKIGIVEGSFSISIILV